MALVLVVLTFSVGDAAWQYLSNNSVDGTNRSAFTNSITPFSGNGFAREQSMLMVRNHSIEGYGVVFGFNFHVYSGTPTIRVRFGNGAAEIFSVTYLSGYRDMMIVNEQAEDFINKVKKHNRVIVEQDILNFGLYNFEYILSGINWNRLK